MTVNCFSSTLIVLIYSVLIDGTTLMTSVIAGLTVGTTFSICSTLFDVMTLVPSSVTLCSRTTAFLSVSLKRVDVTTYSTTLVLVSVTTV